MKFRTIRAEKASYPIALMCACLSVSRSGYYAWESRPESGRVLDDKHMAGEVEAVFKASRRTYGYPRIHRDLQNKGRRIGRHRVARLMREKGLQSIHRRRFRVATTQADPAHQAAENTLNRQFKVEKPNDVWVADITCVPTAEGWLYLALLVDLYARRIVGWSMDDHMRTELPLNAWKMGLSRARGRGHPGEHEPQGRMPRQRGGRERVRDHQGGVGAPSEVRHTRRGPGGAVRVHGGLLQPKPPALGAGLPDAGGFREANQRGAGRMKPVYEIGVGPTFNPDRSDLPVVRPPAQMENPVSTSSR